MMSLLAGLLQQPRRRGGRSNDVSNGVQVGLGGMSCTENLLETLWQETG
jgi:hypothetical protein